MPKLIQKKTTIVLVLVILMGLSMRIYQLQRESLYIDEALDATQSTDTISGLVRYFFSVGHFPTYFMGMHYWIKLFGRGEFALRLPSVIFGVLSIYLIFLLGKMLFNETTGLVASYLLAVSPINIFYSQSFGPYNLASLSTLLSFLFFYKALNKGTRLSWFLYAGFTLLPMFVSITVFPILACQLLFAILLRLRYGKEIKLVKILLVFTALLGVYLPVLAVLLLAKMKIALFYPLSDVTLPPLNAIVNILNLFGGDIYQNIIGQNIGKNHFLILPASIFGFILFLLFLLGVFNLYSSDEKNNIYHKRRESMNVILLLMWCGMPFVFSCFKVFNSSFGQVRYVLYASFAYYLLVSRGIMHFKKKTRIFVFVCLCLAGLLFLREYYRVEKRTNWRQICSYIKNNIKSDEKTAFIVNNSIPISYAEHTMLTYYSTLPIIGIRTGQPSGLSEDRLREYEALLKTIQTHALEDINYKGIWLVTWELPSVGRLQLYTIEQLKRKYILLEEEVFYDVSLHHFRMKN